MSATRKLFLDGVDGLGDTYFQESAANVLSIAVGNTVIGKITSTGGVWGGGDITPTAAVDCAAGTTARASLRIRDGVAPTTPNSGEIWADGTTIFYRNSAGVTKSIAFAVA